MAASHVGILALRHGLPSITHCNKVTSSTHAFGLKKIMAQTFGMGLIFIHGPAPTHATAISLLETITALGAGSTLVGSVVAS